jgi:glyoxylase-like metal-dependent hydrolase (beta-lactamase superfamily II)
VPHVNAWAIAAANGVLLVDTGLYETGALAQLELALDQAGLRLEHVRLVVCTHAHSDHYGLAAPILEAASCELWMHPSHGHMTAAAGAPERLLERRIEIARQGGAPPAALAAYAERRRAEGTGVAEVVLPNRGLVDGVEVATDLGAWRVYETPGHAPSHVVLHQPERRLLLSGDHVLGRISLYYDYGYTHDPAGEFLRSLDVVAGLPVRLVLAGHGRPRADAAALVAATRREAEGRIECIRAAIADQPRTPFELVPVLFGEDVPQGLAIGWGLSEVLCYLRHLELQDRARRIADEEPARWAA